MNNRRKYGGDPIPRRGQIISRITRDLADYITGITKLVEEPLLGRSGQRKWFTNNIDGSEPLLSSGDQIETQIKNEVIGWYLELKLAEQAEESDENFIKFVEKMRKLALHAEDIVYAFIDNRERQHERGCFMKFAFFYPDMIARYNFRKQIMNIRVNMNKLTSEVEIYDRGDDVEDPPQPLPRLQLWEPSSSESETSDLGFDENFTWSIEEGAAWETFKREVDVPDELEEVGKAIVRRCMGYHEMILKVGALLAQRDANKEQWNIVLEQIKQSQASRYQALNEAANALPSYMKQCLFCFGLFQEDYDIPARRLIVLWVAEGLIRQENNGRERSKPPEFKAEGVLEKFAEKNMIQVVKWKPNNKIKTCRMNVVLRDLWMPKAKKADFFHTRSKTTNANSSSEVIMIDRLADHISNNDRNISFSHIHGNGRSDSSDIWSYYKNLTTFLSFDTREGDAPGEDIGNFLRKGISRMCFQRLRVLDLERVFRPKLPDSIGKLICLRYLGLRWTYIEKLPSSIANLLTLQTLDLKHTDISTLQISWWKMKQLRHLYLSENYRSRFVVPRGRNSLADLQTLRGAFLDDECPVDGLLSLTNLRKLGLVIQLGEEKQNILLHDVGKMKGLESLRLRSINESVKPSALFIESLLGLTRLSSLYLSGSLENSSVLETLPENLTDLTLSLSKLNYDPMPRLGKLQNLIMLRIFGEAYIKNVMTCKREDFPKLRVLKLWKQEKMDTWDVEEGSLRVLQELEIRSSKNLKMIPDGFKHLTVLRELKLTNMPKEFTESLMEKQGEDWERLKTCLVLNES